MANDLDALDRLFAPGDETLRGDAGGLLIGHETISAFRQGRGGAPQRSIVDVHVRAIDDDNALVIAVTQPRSGGRGQQTQLWQRGEAGWVVRAAHVSLPAAPISAAIWRIVGSPLVAGAASGPLAGLTFAVKDLFEVEGFAVGAGVPAYLASAQKAAGTATVVQQLLDAGASVQGIGQTDEFAYSIAGRNVHYGTPPNGAVVGALPGGSSSGPASAVATGQVAIGLGTDTGGSIRVPASFQGLWGLRTTHGAVSRSGLLPLAPSFDTVGWLTREAATLSLAAGTSLDLEAQGAVTPDYVIAPALLALCTPAVQDAFAAVTAELDVTEIVVGDLDQLFEAFRMTQAAEAWASDGEWVEAHPGALGADTAARFAFAKSITEEQGLAAAAEFDAARERLDELLGERVLLVPSAPCPAPSATASNEELDAMRANTLRLTCIAGITGRPGLSAPLMTTAGGPVGLGFVGPRYTDLALIELAASLL
jgi:amidase